MTKYSEVSLWSSLDLRHCLETEPNLIIMHTIHTERNTGFFGVFVNLMVDQVKVKIIYIAYGPRCIIRFGLDDCYWILS